MKIPNKIKQTPSVALPNITKGLLLNFLTVYIPAIEPTKLTVPIKIDPF